ncbi:hypothetical protein JOF39_002398 [Glutamicibacter protophormiae]|uniref:Uncharacterized protein n=1 Tax=Glutamicibacter protophormiae TaxID=37930 RepID=A0ABS4XS29_GLUPR|nr:hypothetical protein [Glutamicibacter protophormiae]
MISPDFDTTTSNLLAVGRAKRRLLRYSAAFASNTDQ